MSHIVKSKIEVKNVGCLEKAIEKCGLQNLGNKTHELYGGQRATGIAISLPGWNYPVVINPENGEVKYDNYNGSWGKQQELDKLMQRYSAEVTNEQALMAGFDVQEQQLENGDLELHMTQIAAS